MIWLRCFVVPPTIDILFFFYVATDTNVSLRAQRILMCHCERSEY